MRAAIALALALLAGTAHASESVDSSWQPHQIALGAAALALHVIDWGQTRQVARSHEPGYTGPTYIERGPVASSVIGSTPSRGQVDAYMVVTGLVMGAAAHFLPEYRTALLAGFGAGKLAVVIHNRAIGVQFGGAF